VSELDAVGDANIVEPLVRVRGAARTFGRGISAVVALHGVDCDVLPGRSIAITGPSGSGKSTLLHLMAGLDVPTRGTVTWPALGERAALRPGPVAVVFQVPSLVTALDVLENVALPLVLAGCPPSGQLVGRLPDELSGGQAQRVAVARVLAGTPRLILADEPTGQLDHATADQVIGALLHTATSHGATTVVTTHDARIAGRFGERWPMADGGLAARSVPCSA